MPMMGWLTSATWNFHVYVRLILPMVKFRTREPRVSRISPDAVLQRTLSENSVRKWAGKTEMLDPVSTRKSLEERSGEGD